MDIRLYAFWGSVLPIYPAMVRRRCLCSMRATRKKPGRSTKPLTLSASSSTLSKTAKEKAELNTNEITCRQNGDYLIPNIGQPEQTDHTPLGRYGRMRREYLKEHRPILWNRMILDGTLFPRPREIDRAAYDRLDRMITARAKAAGATEALKAVDPLKWVGLMNACKAQAEEIIPAEHVYS